MHSLYFHKDSKRGVVGTFSRLLDELRELEDSLEAGGQGNIEAEFADVLAWLFSLANLVDVDLEKVASDKYSGTCPKCAQKPCRCIP